MIKSVKPSNHPLISNNTGVLLVNLGTPEGYDYFSVRKYLKQFLSDQRVIELNPMLWKIILNCFILPFRPFAAGKKYKKIWINEINESPLKHYMKSLALKLHDIANKKYPFLIVDYAMRYGNPSLKEQINKLITEGCTKIIFIPLYPQYCSATTATVSDEIYRVLSKIRWQPEVRIVGPYHDNKVYINALVNSIKNHINNLDFIPDAILSSYHGIPKVYFEHGDPYSCYCYKTHRLLNEELITQNISIQNYISFQSRFGPKEWLKPYTIDVLKELLSNRIKKLIVITPGFSCDCLETLEEVNIEYKRLFMELGGEKFSVVPCLNDSLESVMLIDNLLSTNIFNQ